MTVCTIIRDPGRCPYAANPFHLRGWDVMRDSLLGHSGIPSPFKENRRDNLYKLSIDWRNYMEGQAACFTRFEELNPISTMQTDPLIAAVCDLWADDQPVTDAEMSTVLAAISLKDLA